MPKRVLSGLAVRDSLNKTVLINVQTLKQHKRYKKMIKSKKNYLVHDEKNSIKVGDSVRIQEHIPISKKKKWIVIE